MAIERYELMVNGAHGIYVPQTFAENYDAKEWHIDDEDIDIFLEGPDHEHYWYAWEYVLNTAYAIEKGVKYTLWQEDGDLFAEREMSDDELAENIAEENGLDVEAFKVFVDHTGMYALSEAYDVFHALKAFEDAYQGTFDGCYFLELPNGGVAVFSNS